MVVMVVVVGVMVANGRGVVVVIGRVVVANAIVSWRCQGSYLTEGYLHDVTHQTCLVLWTWRKLADETNVKNAPKIC